MNAHLLPVKMAEVAMTTSINTRANVLKNGYTSPVTTVRKLNVR